MKLQLRDSDNPVSKQDIIDLEESMVNFIGDSFSDLTAKMHRQALNKALKTWGKA